MIPAELMKYLTPQQAERMRALETLFASEGWKYLLEWAENGFESAKLNALSATNWADNRVAIGRMSVYGELAGMENGSISDFENMALQEQQARAQAEMDAELEYE